MGNSLNDYRQAIGLYNNKKMCASGVAICLRSSSVIILVFIVIMLLVLLSGDIELNPGPVRLKSLTVCHVNIRGLSDAKMRAIKTTLCKKFDIITLSETFLNPDSTTNLNLSGYHTILRKDRPTFGGGIAIFIRENIVFKRKFDYDSRFVENMWVEISTTNGKLLLCNTYRPPNFTEFWEHFDSNIEFVKSESDVKNIIVLGDLNADFSTANGKKMGEICMLQDLHHHINEPTRITADTQSCLDQILSNVPYFVSETFVDPPVSTNDHCTVGVSLLFKIAPEPAYYRHIWLYDQADFDGFANALTTVDWDKCCFDNDDVNIACRKWTEIFLDIAKLFIPNRSVLVRPRDSPWYTSELRKMKRKVIRLYHKAKSKMTSYHWNSFKSYRNTYHECLTKAELEYNQDLCDSLNTCRNGKKWWQTVKHMIGKGNDQSYPPTFDENSKCYVTSFHKKPELFNNFFLSHSNVDSSNVQLPDDNGSPDFVLDSVVVSENEVYDLLQSLDVNKSTGHDGISARMLKGAGMAIVTPLTKLLNMCLSQKRVPDEWKKANVLPLHKKGDKDKCTNYRPVSILPITSKILERVVFKHVFNFFLDHNLLTSHQSGFRPNDSTVNQLAYLYHTFCNALDKKKDVRIVFCDISKAFDRVWHPGIIYKLKRLGIEGNLLEFFKDYLANRQQRVVIKGQYSSWDHLKAGVPQGSVLGPLLFLVYINDLVNVITCDVKLFADDTVLYTVTDNQQQSADELNSNLERVNDWANQWLVKFNPTKTKLMNISLKKTVDFDNYPVKFGSDILQDVSTQRHLGIEISSNLKWSFHIDKLIQGVSKLCNVMQRLKYKLDRKTLENIYTTFVRPKLEYASIIWDNCTETDKIRLENVQLSFARIVTGAKRGTSHALIYNELSWQTLAERRITSKFKFMHNIVYGMAPNYLCELLPPAVNTTTDYNLRNNTNIRQFNARTEVFRKSLFSDCISKWNSLSDEVRNIVNLKEFMTEICSKTASNPIYSGVIRKLGIIHAQFRMRCSNLKADLFRLHVADDPRCICSNDIEDCEHFFFHCSLYTAERGKLMAQIQLLCNNVAITTDLLLYGSAELTCEMNKQIFVIVETYIDETGRF